MKLKVLEPKAIATATPPGHAHYNAGMNMDRWQAVVRIYSLQNLTKLDNKGEAIPGTGERKEVLEYVVVEKKASGGTESWWYVCGTIEETTRM
ncbi:hypothetical protein RUND412_007688 [Rhizina undulata]